MQHCIDDARSLSMQVKENGVAMMTRVDRIRTKTYVEQLRTHNSG